MFDRLCCVRRKLPDAVNPGNSQSSEDRIERLAVVLCKSPAVDKAPERESDRVSGAGWR